MRAHVSLVAMLGTLACARAGAFQCETPDDCGADGACEPPGYCSFPDAACDSGRRYGEHAGDGLGGGCVPVDDETSDGSTTDPSTSTTLTSSTSTTDPSTSSTSTGDPCPGWWDPAWPHRRTLVFDRGQPSEGVSGFPVLVVLDSRRIDYSATEADGSDIRFIDGDGRTLLPHEIERWNPDGTSYLWVRVPDLDASGMDRLFLYHGNPGAAGGEDAPSVWALDFRAVWHLHDDFRDSTANVNDGLNQGSTDAQGQVADGQSFDGIDDGVDIGPDPSLSDVFAGGGTVSAWISPVGWGGTGFGRIADKSDDTSGIDGWVFQVDDSTSSGTEARTLKFQGPFDGVGGLWEPPTDAIVLGVWQHVAVVYDHDSVDNDPSFYIDGVAQPTTESEIPSGVALPADTPTLSLGSFSDSDTRSFDGIIDEVRIADIARSAAWMAAVFASETDVLISHEPAETCP